MKSLLTFRSFALAVLMAGTSLAIAGCGETSNVSNVAGHSGPSGQADARSSGVGPGGHQPATNGAANVGPTGAGPAGSQ